jgi:hypothetical protein
MQTAQSSDGFERAIFQDCNLFQQPPTGAGAGLRVQRHVSRRAHACARKAGESTERERLAAFAAGTAFKGWSVEFGAAVCPSVVAPLFGGVRAAQDGFFAELQGQFDLARCWSQVERLAAAMRRDGRECSDTTKADAASAGALALARWRAIGARHPQARLRGTVGAVAWRAVVREVASDQLGDAVTLANMTAEDWHGSALPLPQLRGDDSRGDRASRLLFERARAKRVGLLQRRLASLTAAAGRGANGARRREAVERVGRAVLLLLHGDNLDCAAVAAGFTASQGTHGTVRAGDRLLQAARRLGLGVQFTVRQRV